MSTVQLTDRILYSDGDSAVPVTKVLDLVSSGVETDGIFVEFLTKEIREFNQYVPKNEQITIKTMTRPNNISWNIPQEYVELDPVEYTIERFHEMAYAEGEDNFDERKYHRLAVELALYDKMNLMPVLRLLIYIINTLRKNNIVWGIGRGSSVSSYVLYVLGVHDIDSVKYELDIKEFLRD